MDQLKKGRTVEVVLTIDVPDGEQFTNEIIATFFNWEICHIVKEESEGDLSVQKIDVREKNE